MAVELEKQKSPNEWAHMKFLSEYIGINNPTEVIDEVRESIEDHILEYSPENESFEEEFEK